ncbi:cytochrome P450 [Aspergillus pseudonomiae]|uniref:Cytochrome P450 n=1 Tax=Aspergillus pseudonomiae TaxID=1506151 RepID=A0A5N7DV54_9EURO|nr:cytochrome P450 [Aspergillus pseudonomiae]KAE8409388.1 cytochrome P450 [Aspergillus pseudonomiae]
MAFSQLVVALVTSWLTHRVYLIVYRLYFHRLAKFPGPRLAAISTLYRAFYQIWKDGKLIEHATELHDLYGPVIRISPNELHFRSVAAYHDIYSAKFQGTKDPDYYEHLGQSTALFGLVDPIQHGARFRLVAHLFSKRHFDSLTARINAHISRFSQLLSLSAQNQEICNLSFGFRSVALDIVNDFIFGDLPHKFRQLKNETFLEPLAVGTYDAMNWWIWLSRNYPTLLSLIQKMPSSWLQSMTHAFEAPKIVVELVTSMVDDALTVRPKDWHERFFYCIVHGLEGQNRNGSESASVPSSVLVEEVMGTMLGGVIDIANILPYGAFQLSQSPQLQDRLYEELRGAWTNITDPIPDYETLCTLPLLNGLVKESVRLTHGVISGPPRAVGPLGAVIDGYSVPPKSVVTTTSLYLHMDADVFPQPETFDPLRWVTGNPKQMENAIVAFSKGRRMCPAKHLAYMEMFSIFAMLFRRFQVSSYETDIHDFDYSEYLSLHFRGKPLRVKLRERPS